MGSLVRGFEPFIFLGLHIDFKEVDCIGIVVGLVGGTDDFFDQGVISGVNPGDAAVKLWRRRLFPAKTGRREGFGGEASELVGASRLMGKNEYVF